MGKKATSQWDFGELFPAEPTRRVYGVAELTAAVKRLLEEKLGSVWVTGEVSNFRLQSSGHAYFTLKDATSQMSCVLFRGTSTSYRELLEDGCKLVVQGELTVYEPRGQYQLVVRQLELQGVGALQVAFEKLKRKLDAEGLFAADRKRPVPAIIERLGIVTSPTGAALRDVLHVITRRDPALQILLAPCRVQGELAGAEVAAAIGRLDRWAVGGGEGLRLDAILVTRGGGSLEDLWAFNEEVVARAMAASRVPVVSAVGHEIDFTIADFVADLRAATPSAAGEILTEGVYASRAWLAEMPGRLARALKGVLEDERERLGALRARAVRAHPSRRVEGLAQRLDDLRTAMERAVRGGWRMRAAAWGAHRRRWRALRPGLWFRREHERLETVTRRLTGAATGGADRARERLQQGETRLRLLSPQNVLERGFSITWDAETGSLVRRASSVRVGQRLLTRLQEGEIQSEVTGR